MQSSRQNFLIRYSVAAILPLIAAIAQWLIWPYIPPLTWLLFYPAVFFSAWIGGLVGGLIATLFSLILGVYFFIPPLLSWQILDFRYSYSAVVFSMMGLLFSLVHERLQKAYQQLKLLHTDNLNTSRTRLDWSLAAAKAGLWEWNLQTQENEWSDGLWELYGLPVRSQKASYETWLATVHPEDREEIVSRLMLAVQTAEEIELEWRVANTAPDQERWLMSQGKAVLNGNGQPLIYRGIVLDITRLKQLEFSLRDQERFLAESQNVAHVGSWMVDIKSGVLSWSEETFRLYGLDPESDNPPALETFSELLYPVDRPAMQIWIGSCLAGDELQPLEFRTVSGERWLMGSGKLETDADGQPFRMIGTVQDITEAKRMAARMQRWADAFQYCANGIVISNPETLTLETCNPAFARMLGYADPAQLTGKPILSLYPGDCREQVKLYFQQAEQSGTASYESRYLHSNGSSFAVQVDLTTIKDEINGYHYRLATVQNIEMRKQTEAQLYLRSRALDAAANGILITDDRNVIEWVNPAFTTMTGYSANEAIGLTPQALFKSAEHEQQFYERQWDCISSGKVWHGEIRNRRKDGSYYQEEKIITPVFDEQGHIRHYIAIKQNISDRKQTEAELVRYRDQLEQLVDERTNELRLAREEAEHLSEVKSAFLANMSHEIRTPMHAVLGFCYLLDQRPLDEEAKQLLVKIHSAGHSLLTIINDILDFSKIEAGHLDIEKRSFRLSILLDELANLMESVIHSKKLELIITPPETVDALIGDVQHIKQVLVNLLSNAIKFTEQGEVELRISIDAMHDKHAMLRFLVRDTGIGISPEMQSEIFSAFTQADTSISRRFGGTGLGLAISQRLVKLMGGTLEVQSQIGKGSEFCFALDLEIDLDAKLLPPKLANLELLIADDSETARAALVATAKSLGWLADDVNSGKSAVSRFIQRWQDLQSYDILLLDWKMPKLDGLEVARAIVETLDISETRQRIPPIIIMVTAYTRGELMLEPGIRYVDAVLCKPVTPSSLYNAVNAALLQRRQTEAPVSRLQASRLHRIPGLRVLVVDDSEINREVAKRILESEGAVVRLAGDGEEAVNWLLLNKDQIDVVLMDVQMPKMDGYTAARILRQDPELEKLPIIALTAGAFQSLRDAAYAAGMDDFITKPFDIEQLMAKLQRLCPFILEKLDYIPVNAPTATPMPIASTINPDAEELTGIDFETGLKQWGNKIVYRTYLYKFVENYEKVGSAISEHLLTGDTVFACNLVHKLKGVAANLALTKIVESVHVLEKLLQEGVLAIAAADELQSALDEVCASITKLKIADDEVPKMQMLDAIVSEPAELLILLNQFLQALDEDSPAAVDPLLLELYGKIPVKAYSQIEAQISDFDFRGAEATILALLVELKS